MASPLTVVARYRDFRLLFIAQLVMFGGDWFVMIPLLGQLPDLTASALLGSLTLAADTGLNALLMPYAGTVADRFDRRRILVASNAAALLAVLHAAGDPGAGAGGVITRVAQRGSAEPARRHRGEREAHRGVE